MLALTSPIYQVEQIREFERLATERYSLSDDALMNRAAKAAFDFIHRRWAQAQKIVIVCGTGHNGGDGAALGVLAKERGLSVMIYTVGAKDHLKPLTEQMFAACRDAGIPMEAFDPKVQLHADLIIDAICGIGVKENLHDEAVQAIQWMERSQIPIFALDVPSGIDADTGQVLGAAVHANATMTFIGYKLGLLTGSGVSHTGELVMHDLQLPMELHTYVSPIAERLHLNLFQSYLKPRHRDWHKGLSGHVLIVGGGPGHAGAVRMAGEAALRIGAGLVTIATQPEHVASMTVHYPEIMTLGVATPDDLEPLLENAKVVVLGPGLGLSPWAEALWQRLMEVDIPMVLDADGLNLLAGKTMVKSNWVLTPHPGEAARLLGVSAADVQSDRLASVKAMMEQFGGVAILKGAGSLIFSASALPALCDKGNPGMASAGMGDVLSGVIGGLIAQGLPLPEAAKLGVMIHALAGDLAAKEGERGMIATDLLPYLRRLMNPPSTTL